MPVDTPPRGEKLMCCYPVFIPLKDKNASAAQIVLQGGRKMFVVPCGKCYECMRAQSTEWALRIMLEATAHERNCCLTLTYNDEHLPDNGLLRPNDVTLWLKRLRKAIAPVSVRYFYSGEYGDLHGRPHYHVILFGYAPDDLVYSFTKNGHKYYRSAFIQKTWSIARYDNECKRMLFDPIGNIIVTDLTFRGAFYSAKYLQKALFKDMPVKPFVRMSTHPGIGLNRLDTVDLNTGKVYFDGRTYSVPKYFIKQLKKTQDLTEFSERRRLASLRMANLTVDSLEVRQAADRAFWNSHGVSLIKSSSQLHEEWKKNSNLPIFCDENA